MEAMVSAELVYHYTSRQGSQDIISSSLLKPGRDNKTYLTPDDYSLGAEASNRLAITGKPVELRLRIPVRVISNPSLLTRVKAKRSETQMIRQGFGWEFTIGHSIPVQGLQWDVLAAP